VLDGWYQVRSASPWKHVLDRWTRPKVCQQGQRHLAPYWCKTEVGVGHDAHLSDALDLAEVKHTFGQFGQFTLWVIFGFVAFGQFVFVNTLTVNLLLLNIFRTTEHYLCYVITTKHICILLIIRSGGKNKRRCGSR
jgi:hypothetical protein